MVPGQGSPPGVDGSRSARPFPIHTFLFALSPVLFVFAHNISTLPVAPQELLLPAGFALLLAAAALLVSALVARERSKAGTIASLFVLLFFLYGHAFGALAKWQAAHEYARHYYLLPLWLALLLVGAWLVARRRRSFAGFTVVLNLIAAAVLLTNVVSGLPGMLRRSAAPEAQPGGIGAHSASLPDIYYIILDGYARADILEQVYDYDNSGFLDFLRERGFRVAAGSRSNYAQTYLSLASSLNYAYLDSLASRVRSNAADRVPLTRLIEKNRVLDFLKRQGYTFVAFASGYAGTEFRNADVFLAPRWSLSEFQNVLLATTPLPPLLELLARRSQFDLHRQRVLFTLENLARAAGRKNPAFVFAHVLSPHPPFVFGANGEKVNPSGYFTLTEGGGFQAVDAERVRSEYIESYRNQLAFLNLKLRETVYRILAQSARPPVIILQADHGPGSILNWDDPAPDQIAERMAILNAFLLPEPAAAALYDSITPVNTFRLIFNSLFGTHVGLISDRSYFSTISHPYEFHNVDSLRAYGASRGTDSLERLAIVAFRLSSKGPDKPGLYARRLVVLRFGDAPKSVARMFVKTVAENLTIEQALAAYGEFVRTGELPDFRDTVATYHGRGPDREPVAVLYFRSASPR